jgi:hemerythrin superfamily protein
MEFVTRRTAAALIVAATLMPPPSVGAQSSNADIIGLLEREHRAAKGLMDGIAGSTNTSERQRLFEKLVDALTIHNATEENIIYPALRSVAHRSSDATTLYHQQDDAKVMIWDMTALPKDDARFTTRFRELRSAFLAHVRQEERVDFPAVRAAMGTRIRDLDDAAHRLRAHWRTIAGQLS